MATCCFVVIFGHVQRGCCCNCQSDWLVQVITCVLQTDALKVTGELIFSIHTAETTGLSHHQYISTSTTAYMQPRVHKRPTLDVATSGYHCEHKHITITSASLHTLGSPPTGEGSCKLAPCTHSLYRPCTKHKCHKHIRLMT